MLVEHAIDDVDERLIATEVPMPSGQQIALKPALAQVLAQHLHHPPGDRQVLVHILVLGIPALAAHLIHGL